MRTYGHREGNITHWGPFTGGIGEGQQGVGRLGRDNMGRRKGRRGEGGREGREGRKSNNERDVADLDVEVYKLNSFF